MKNRSLRDNLQQIIDPAAAPAVLTIHYNDTKTDLIKVQRPEDGSVYWVGTPTDAVGRPCRYSLIVESNGFMVGSAAINFITNQGWGNGRGKPDAVTKSHAANEFRRAFLQACLIHGNLEKDWSLAIGDMLTRSTNLVVEPGDIDQNELIELTLLGVPHQYVQAAHSNGFHFVLDIQEIIGRRVSDTYAAILPGDWDEASEEVSMTSNLTQADVYLMKRRGLKFAKVAQLRGRK